MNCFRYSLPLSHELHQMLASIPDLAPCLRAAPERVQSRELLESAARQLIEPGIAGQLAERCAGMIRFVLERLSEDDRVQTSLGEYYGLRLLATEFESAVEHFQADRDRSRFERLGAKLQRELTQPSSSRETTGFDQTTGPALVHAAN